MKNGGVTIDNWSYELSGNHVSGTAQIPDLDNPEFTISLEADNFKTYPSRQFFRFFDAEMDGSADFKIVGSGNLNDLSSLKFEGEMKLKELKIRPQKFFSIPDGGCQLEV